MTKIKTKFGKGAKITLSFKDYKEAQAFYSELILRYDLAKAKIGIMYTRDYNE